VLFAIDRAGLVGADGPTHAGSFDLSFLRCIPNMVIMAPSDENECRQMLTTGFYLDGPSAVRYPRGCGTGADIDPALDRLEIGKAVLRRKGRKVAILAFGSMVSPALQAAERLDASVADMRFVKPLDVDMIKSLADEHELLVTIEENAVMGGAGSAVNEYLREIRHPVAVKLMGLPDRYIEHGGHQAQLAECGLDMNGLVDTINRYFSS
jgi:1-deoxy-D-xylulose-5-phosphate synthase